ncbi:hypothetical protein LTR37_003516 [Vermiconidia calcicola]|uniref:Uncharacterized protein n=1 Tax=Vermiconidia calcicola TaxID=1690605 RepID=A0ACC3NQ36_9PEZI|nr:hypothetical protein LTR37_003516 [Vermiconidia calcicola]
MSSTQNRYAGGDTHLRKGGTNIEPATSTVAASFPFELIETILLNLSITDIVVVAANVPKFWRKVIENSKEIWKRLATRYPPVDAHRLVQAKGDMEAGISTPLSFRYTVRNSILFVHRTAAGAEAYIFAPVSDKKPLCVIDPSRTTAEYTKTHRFGYGYMELFDFDGMLVCSVQVSTNKKDIMWLYLTTIYGAAEKQDQPARKRLKTSGLRWDGDSEVMARV